MIMTDSNGISHLRLLRVEIWLVDHLSGLCGPVHGLMGAPCSQREVLRGGERAE